MRCREDLPLEGLKGGFLQERELEVAPLRADEQ